MNWVLLAVLVAVVSGLSPLLSRHVAKTAPVYGYTLMLHVFGMLFLLPLFLLNPIFPSEPVAWFLLAASVVVWVGGMLLGTLSLKRTHASLRTPLLQTQLLWTVFLAFLILREAVTPFRVAGVLLVFAGAFLISADHLRLRDFIRSGILVTILAAFTWSIADLIDKQAMAYFTPITYSFLEYALITLALLAVASRYASETKRFLRARWGSMALISLASVVAYTLSMLIYQHLDLSVAATVFASGDIVTVLGALLVFPEERVAVPRKIIATLLVIAGVIIASFAA